jgi:myo-inositol-1(or 4)-monophosphatase
VSKTVSIKESLIGTGFPFREISNFEEYLRMFSNVTKGTAGVRRPGAAALDLAYVAAGRYDGFFEAGLSKWDMAAGALMIREAGGLVGDFDGEEAYLESGRIVAANAKLFSPLLQLLKAR